jgi:acyl-coenzyme A synthetase/AMP-(fatty) acid ligase
LKTERHFPITDRKSEEIIAIYRGEKIEVGQFITEIKALALTLPDHRYAFNLFTNRYEYLLGFCASILAGHCTLMPPNRLDNTLEELAQQYPDSYMLGATSFSYQEFENGAFRGKPGEFQRDDIPLIPADQLCAVAFTSGSTGEPSPNLKYWHTLRSGSLGNIGLLLKNTGERLNIVATVPPQHMWGLETSILFPLFTNVTISDQTPFYPQNIAEAIQSLPTPRALVSSPIHLRALLKSGVSLPGLDHIFSATAPLSEEVARLLEKQFDTRVFEVFGCTESGIIAGRYTTEETSWHLSELFELEVNKANVLVKAEHLPTDVVINDVIEKIDDHRFKWHGRHQDMVNIAGKRGSLTDLNRRLLAIPAVTDGVIFSPADESERLVAIVVAPGLKPADIVDALKTTVDSVFLPRPVYMVSALPRQETGKLASSAIRQLYEDILKKKCQKQEKA